MSEDATREPFRGARLVPGLLAGIAGLAVALALLGTETARAGVIVLATGCAALALWTRLGLARGRARARMPLARASSEPLAELGRDFSGPSRVIAGMAERVAAGPLDAEQRNALEAIQRASRRLRRLRGSLEEAAARSEPGPDAERVCFSLPGVVAEAARTLQPEAELKGLQLCCELRPDLPDEVRGDPERLARVLEGLLAAVIDATESGEITLEAVASGATAASVGFELRVGSVGAGSLPEGALSLVRRQLASLGGRLRAEPARAGRPPTLAIELELASEPVRQGAPEATLTFRGRRALVLEGSELGRRTLGELLRSLGMQPTLMGQPDTALGELRRAAHEGQPYALAIVDSTLRGSMVFRARRAADDPVVAATPKILLWSPARLSTSPDDAPRLAKPITRPELVSALRKVLGRAEPGPEAPAPAPSLGTARRVLVLEPSPVSALVLARLVELAGAEAVPVAEPEEVVAQPDAVPVVLLDTSRAEAGAWAEALRRLKPELRLVGLRAAGQAVPDARAFDALVDRLAHAEELRAALDGVTESPAAEREPAREAHPFDRRKLARNLGDNEDAAQRVLQRFVEQAASPRLREAEQDLPALAQTAHRLRGALLWITAERAAAAAAALEERALEGDAPGARAALELLEQELSAVLAAIRGGPGPS